MLDFNFPENLLELTRLGHSSLLVDFIRSCNKRNQLTDWDVCIQSREKLIENADPIKDLINHEIYPLDRSTMDLSHNNKYISFTARSAVANPDTPKLGLTNKQITEAEKISAEKIYKLKENSYSVVRTRPMLILLPVTGGTEKFREYYPNNNFISLACSIPSTINVNLQPRTYQVNSVFRRNQYELNFQNDEDESVIYAAR